jgi:transcriptional regulator with XRE-family HTH domain
MERRPDYTTKQREAFGQALRMAREDAGLSATEVAARLGYRSGGAVNNWETGRTPPEPVIVFALEQLCEVDPGMLSQHLGYLPAGTTDAPCTVETALASDASLSPSARDAVRMVYREFRASAR